jgi:hypothetical protein
LSFGKFMYRAIAMGFLERILRACLDGGYWSVKFMFWYIFEIF